MLTPVIESDLDALLATQLVVAYAGEDADAARLGWWKTDIVSEYGGLDLFRRLYPSTWRWAALRAVRAAAIAADRDARRRAADPDAVISIFHLGFALDEQLEDRLDVLAAAHPNDPHAALDLTLVDLGDARFDPAAFVAWAGTSAARPKPDAIGRKVPRPPDLATLTASLRAALVPLPTPSAYPLPYAAP